MYRHSIRQCDHAQEASWKFFNFAPEPETIFFLRLNANWIFDDANANLFRQIRTLPKNLILTILGELVIGHAMNLFELSLQNNLCVTANSSTFATWFAINDVEVGTTVARCSPHSPPGG
jgi:hypothetical protein